MKTAEEHLADAFSALLRGDTTGRDRHAKLAEQTMKDAQRAAGVRLVKGADGVYAPQEKR